MNDPELRAYLLGQASETEAERLEVRLLDDDQVFVTLRGVEDDLFDAYAQGTLTTNERQRFLERYGTERARMLMAHALAARTQSARVLSSRRFGRQWVPVAAAAALVAGIGVTIWMQDRPAETGATVRPPINPELAGPAVLLITLGSSRSSATVPEVTLANDTPSLQLRVRLDPADRFDSYSMELRSAAGVLVWRGDNLRAATEGGDLMLVGLVPAIALTAGSYELSARGSQAAAPEETLGFAALSVRR